VKFYVWGNRIIFICNHLLNLNEGDLTESRFDHTAFDSDTMLTYYCPKSLNL
jgi:hypothetical protein